ncbi:hypothetical protein RUND412_001065 [Rhizina undulata]
MATPQLSSHLQHLWKASHALATDSPAVSAHLISTLYNLSFEKELTLADSTSRQTCSACGSLLIPGWNTRVRSDRPKKKKRPIKAGMVEKNSSTTRTRTTTNGEATTSIMQGAGVSKAEVSGDQKEKIQLWSAEYFHIVYRCRICDRSTKQEIQSKTKPRRKQARDLTSSAATSSLSSSLSVTPLPAEISVSVAVTADTAVAIGGTAPPPPPAQKVSNAGSKKRAKARKGNSLSELLAAKKKQDAGSTGVGGFGLDLMDLMKTG